MDSTENVPAKIQAEAKARALAILNSEPNCISYVRPEDLETAALFIPVVSIIKPTVDDFYPPIPKVGIMAKPQLVNLIREKAGITITEQTTSKRSKYVYVCSGAGEKRQPDGSMLRETASYEFDAEQRAELDFLSDTEGKYSTDNAKRKHVLETAKFGEQRAVTGFQHALIHKLAKIARSFKTPQELMRGMKILRIDRNVNGIMTDPTMRDAVISHALGATETVFGPPKQIQRTYDENGERIPGPAHAEGELPLDDFDDAPPAPEKTPLQAAREMMESYREKISGSAKATKLLEDLVAKKDATIEEINSAIDRFEAWLQKNAPKGGAA
jgi:hypothetical protein